MGENGSTFDPGGYLAVDERERRMEWGAEAGRDYSGWLTVANHGEGGSEVVAHLSFGECSLRRSDTISDTTEGTTPRNIGQPPAKKAA